MTNQQWRPEHASLITPYLTVRDAEAAAQFYTAAFGFERANVMPGPDGRLLHVDMTYRGTTVVMFSPEDTPWGEPMSAPVSSGAPSPVGCYLYCEDVDALYQRALSAGAVAAGTGDHIGPEDMFWGDRIASVRDPDGYCWTLATKVGEIDLSKAPKFD